MTEWQDCSGERCRTLRRTVQRVETERGRSCVNKTVTMAKCAPIDCHFVLADDGKECMSTKKLASVSMTEWSNWILTRKSSEALNMSFNNRQYQLDELELALFRLI